MRIIDPLTYFFLKVVKKYISNQSYKKRFKISQIISSLLYNHLPIRKKLAKKNIKQAFPEKSDHWVDSTLRSCYQISVHHFLKFISFPKSWNNAKYEIKGLKILDGAMKQNRGVILLAAHFGPWELMGAWLGNNGYHLTGVAQKQKNAGANSFFVYQREKSGADHIYRKESFDKMYKILERKKILVLISDQDAKKKGVFVDFLGTSASSPKGAAIFHKNTNAPLVVGTCIEKDHNHYIIEFLPVNPPKKTVKSITQTYTSIFAQFILKYPEQYFWFHDRWKTKNDEKN